MKLHAGNVLVFQHGCVRHDVIAGCRCLWNDWAVIAVGEVEVWFVSDAFKQARWTVGFDLVPTHVRNPQIALKALDDSFEHAEPLFFRGFFARLEQRLQAQADAQERNSCADAFDQRFANAQFVQRPHHLTEMPHAGKNNFRSLSQAFRIAHQFVGGSYRVLACFGRTARFPAP